MHRQRGQPTKEGGTQGKIVSPMRWGSWAFVSHRWTLLWEWGRQGAHSLALEPASCRSQAVSQSTKETFRQMMPALATGKPPPWRQKGLEYGWGIDSTVYTASSKTTPILSQSSPLLVFNLSLLSLSIIYSPTERIFHRRVTYSSAIKYTMLACLFLRFHPLYILHKLRCSVYCCIVNSLTSALLPATLKRHSWVVVHNTSMNNDGLVPGVRTQATVASRELFLLWKQE